MASNKIPKNQKLWNSLRRQAQSRYPNRRKLGGLSQPAAKWLAQEYAKAGGTFVSSKRELSDKDRDFKQEEVDNKKRREKKAETERKKQGLV